MNDQLNCHQVSNKQFPFVATNLCNFMETININAKLMPMVVIGNGEEGKASEFDAEKLPPIEDVLNTKMKK